MADFRGRFDEAGEQALELARLCGEPGFSASNTVLAGWRDLLSDWSFACGRAADHLDDARIVKPVFADVLRSAGGLIRGSHTEMDDLCRRYHVR